MRKSFSIFAIPLLFIFLCSGCSQGLDGDSLEESLRKGHANLTVAYLSSHGFAYRNDEGELTGVLVDIMEEFADFVHYSHGIDINYDFVEQPDFSSLYSNVKNASGGVFGLGNVTITDQRKQEIRFSPPYMTNIAVLISHDSVEDLRELNTIATGFEGQKALAFQGTLHETRLREIKRHYWPEMEMDFSDSNADIIRMVSRGGYFAYIDIYNFWRAAERGEPLKQHVVGDQASERFGIIMPLENDWHGLITDFFDHGQGFLSSRTYKKIMEKHLGPELTAKLERARLEASRD